MKLVRFGPRGDERPGLVDASGRIRDVSDLVGDFGGERVSLAAIERLRTIDPESLPEVAPHTRLGPPLSFVPHFMAVGLNYADHAAETGAPIPREPILFSKAPSCLSGPFDSVVLPPGATKADWEVELAVVIGRSAYRVGREEALGYVTGYCLCNDVSERAWQLEGTGQWLKGKSAPSFGPLGPWLVTADEIPDPQAIDLWLDLNSERAQSGSTRTMIFGVAEVIAYVSGLWRLEPGDVITTGTPPGVGMGRKPPRYLRDGDVLRLGATGLGEQRQDVVDSGSVESPGARDVGQHSST